MTSLRRLLPIVFSGAVTACAVPILGTNAAIPSNLGITTFATGVNYPYGMHALADGSLLVATSSPTTGSNSLFSSNLQILRFTDVNQDGVADGPGTVVFNGPAGPTTGMSGSGNIVAVATGVHTGSSILLLQAGGGGSLTQIGSLQFTYPPGLWWHDSHAVAMRETGGGAYELVFNIGSQDNDVPSVGTAGVSGLVSGTLNPDSIYRLPFTVNGNTVTPGGLTQVASGLRNAFGLGLTSSGNLYIAENGIDAQNGDALSADELNFIAAGNSTVVHFGYPDTYIRYPDGTVVGNTGTGPLAAFVPVAGARSEGPAGLALAPSGFPAGLNNGVFVGFHGLGSVSGPGNAENPVVYVDLATNQYFHFLLGGQPGQGHFNSLASTNNALFVADLSTADFDTRQSGAIYRIALADDVPEPGTLFLTGTALAVCLRRRNRKAASNC